MRVYIGRLMGIVLWVALAPLCAGQGGEMQGAAPAPTTFSLAAVINPTARGAAEEAMRKAGAVNEFYCVTEQKTPLAGGKLLWNKTQFAFRRPNLAYEQLSVQQSTLPGWTGRQEWAVCDGQTIWQYSQNAPGSEAELMQRYRSLPPEEAQRFAERHRTPQATRYDVARLAGAGIGLESLIVSDVVVNLWPKLDPANLMLESETAEMWVFVAPLAKPTPGIQSVRFALGRSDGLARMIEFRGSQMTTLVVSGMVVNPQPRVEDRYFKSPLPVGIEAEDRTDKLIEAEKTGGGG